MILNPSPAFRGGGNKASNEGLPGADSNNTGDDAWAEIRGQRSGVRGQRSEIRGQKSEIRNQKSEIRDQRSECII
jgi:hypothetical protein